MAWFSWGINFRGFRGGPDPRIPVPTKKEFVVWIVKENTVATNFEPHEYVIFAYSTKIRTQENKAIHSTDASSKYQKDADNYINAQALKRNNIDFKCNFESFNLK